MSYPALERLGFRLSRAEHEMVEPGFIHAIHLLGFAGTLGVGYF